MDRDRRYGRRIRPTRIGRAAKQAVFERDGLQARKY
jgi:hypothetical protein